MSIKRQTVLITGAKGGLGTFVTTAFLGTGARVLGVSRSIQQSDFPGEGFVAIPAEMSSAESVAVLVDAVIERFGRLDAAVHLVGAFAGGTAIADTDDATMKWMLDINFWSAFYLARAAVRHMRRNGFGRFIAIGSRAAVEASPNAAAYSASKAALIALVRCLAAENKNAGITANIILPGTMDTPVNRKADPAADYSKWVDPRQVANLAVWLASDQASEVNGAAIPLYGRDG
jgi:NAD(P)-dependent dehydrogenase (short-subunit alcohol dehydrogenase family)